MPSGLYFGIPLNIPDHSFDDVLFSSVKINSLITVSGLFLLYRLIFISFGLSFSDPSSSQYLSKSMFIRLLVSYSNSFVGYVDDSFVGAIFL